MFSIIIPVHNKLPHLDRAVNSVLNQSFKNFELILIDDASTDGSEEKIKKYSDPRIRLFKRNTPGPGGYAARNLGINVAKYDWVAFLDADDKWMKHHLEDIADAISENRDIETVSTNWNMSKNDEVSPVKELQKFKNVYTEFSLIDFFYTKSLMWTGAIAIKTELLKKIGSFPENRCKRGGDMDTWMRCLFWSKRNVFINVVSALYFKDTVNQVTDNKNNPAIKICSEDTIEFIRSSTTDKNLLRAIDEYCAGFVFNMSITSLRRKGKIVRNTRIIKSTKLKCKLILKIYIYRILIFLGLKD